MLRDVFNKGKRRKQHRKGKKKYIYFQQTKVYDVTFGKKYCTLLR